VFFSGLFDCSLSAVFEAFNDFVFKDMMLFSELVGNRVADQVIRCIPPIELQCTAASNTSQVRNPQEEEELAHHGQ
jgi:hypothetical protein